MHDSTINKAIILGKLDTDPEIKMTPNGTVVSKFKVFTIDSYKDIDSGNFIKNTEWHSIIVYGKQAEIISKYAKKGSLMYFEGRMTQNMTLQSTDNKVPFTDIIVKDFQFIGKRDNVNNLSNKNSIDTSLNQIVEEKKITPQKNLNEGYDDNLEDEVPF